jgi:hypothetical protein
VSADLAAAIERIQTVRMLVDQQAKGAALTGHRDQFAHGWHVLEGIDLAMQAIRAPHMKTVEEVNHG